MTALLRLRMDGVYESLALSTGFVHPGPRESTLQCSLGAVADQLGNHVRTVTVRSAYLTRSVRIETGNGSVHTAHPMGLLVETDARQWMAYSLLVSPQGRGRWVVAGENPTWVFTTERQWVENFRKPAGDYPPPLLTQNLVELLGALTDTDELGGSSATAARGVLDVLDMLDPDQGRTERVLFALQHPVEAALFHQT